MLYKYGYTKVYVVDGGIAGWTEKGYPVVNEYLGEVKVTKYNKRLKEEFVVREGALAREARTGADPAPGRGRGPVEPWQIRQDLAMFTGTPRG